MQAASASLHGGGLPAIAKGSLQPQGEMSFAPRLMQPATRMPARQTDKILRGWPSMLVCVVIDLVTRDDLMQKRNSQNSRIAFQAMSGPHQLL